MRSSVAITCPGKARSWCIRIVPSMPLLTTITMTLSPNWTAVASSFPLIRKQPSPATVTTVRSGCRAAAARPAGTPYPIAPFLGASWVPKRRNSKNRCSQIA